VGRVDALQRSVQRRRIKDIAPDDLRSFFDKWPQLIRVSGQTSQDHRLLFEQRDQPTTDVAGCSRQQHDGSIRCFRTL
jgi:hypothetical protein